MNPETSSSSDQRIRPLVVSDTAVYDRFSVALHWTTVALVLTQFALAQTWSWFARPTRHLMVVSHMSFGMILSAVIVIRIVWRIMPSHRMPPASYGWSGMAAWLVHSLLYVMLVTEAVFGFLLRWSGNEAMSFFGLLLAPPFAPFSKPLHHLIGEIHDLNGWAIIILASGHAAAAVYHHVVLGDRVLGRMLPLVRGDEDVR